MGMAKIWSVKAACQPPATVLSTGNNRPLLPRNPLRIKTRFRNYRGRHLEGIAMNSSLASTDLSKARRATEPSNEPLLQPAARNLITRARLRLGKLVSFAFARHLMMFFIGVAATLAWQSYSGAARNRTKQVGRLGTLIMRGAGTRALPGPAVGQFVFLPDPHFVLVPYLYRCARREPRADFRHTCREVFLNASMASGSCL
jgi:hypothetical protein